jgi:hypothetical protein
MESDQKISPEIEKPRSKVIDYLTREFEIRVKKPKVKIESTFYDSNKIKLIPKPAEHIDLVHDIESIFDKYLEKIDDIKTIEFINLISSTVITFIDQKRNAKIIELKSMSNRGEEILKEFLANFYNKYRDEEVLIDKESFRNIAEPILCIFAEYQHVLIEEIYTVLGGKKGKGSNDG